MILHNPEIERAIVSSAIWNPDIYELVFERLTEINFYEPKYKHIFKVAKYAYDETGKVDPITVEAIVLNDKVIEITKGDLADLVGNGSSLANIDAHIDIIESYTIKRECNNRMHQIMDEADSMDGYDMADRLSAIASEIEMGIPAQYTFTPDEIIERESTKPKAEKLHTGERMLDTMMYRDAGLTRGQLEVTLADSGHGKTQFAMYKASMMAKKGFKTLWFQLEDYDLNTALYFKNRIGEYSKNIFICDSLSDIEDIRKQAKAMKREYNIDNIVIDYVQSVTCDRKNKNDQVEYISSQFTKMAKRLNVVVHLLSQVTIKYDLRKGWAQEPRLGDVRWSQQLKQDAHIITGLFRPAVVDGLISRTGFVKDWNGDEIPENTVFVRQLKNRYGERENRRLRMIHTAHGLEIYSDNEPQTIKYYDDF